MENNCLVVISPDCGAASHVPLLLTKLTKLLTELTPFYYGQKNILRFVFRFQFIFRKFVID